MHTLVVGMEDSKIHEIEVIQFIYALGQKLLGIFSIASPVMFPMKYVDLESLTTNCEVLKALRHLVSLAFICAPTIL